MSVALRLVGITVLLATALWSCRPRQAQVPGQLLTQNALLLPDAPAWNESWSTENTLLVHLISDPSSVHPSALTNHGAILIAQLIHGYLLYLNPITLKLEPGICRTLPQQSPDGLQFTYELREGLYWDDGRPVTPEDVIFSFKAYKCPLTQNPAQKPYLENLSAVVASPLHSRRFTLISKDRYVHNESFVIEFPILPRHVYDSANVLARFSLAQFDDPAFRAEEHADLVAWSRSFNHPVNGTDPAHIKGLGPYRLTQWEPGQFITLERKPRHWTAGVDSLPLLLASYPETIVFRFIRDETATKLELLSQKLDASSMLTTRTLMDLLTDSSFLRNYNSAFMENLACNRIYLNTRPDGLKRLPYFEDVRMRKAMAYLVPVDRMIEVLAMKQAVRWTTFLPPFRTDEVDTTLKPIPYDVQAAIRLLEEAGWHDSDNDGIRDKLIAGRRVALEPELSLAALGSASRDAATLIAEAALPAGMRIRIRELETGTLMEKARQHDFDMLLTAGIVSALAKDYSQIWHTRSWEQNGSNYSGFGSPITDALLDSMRRELNDSARIAMSRRLQRIIYEQQPVIFTFSPHRKVVVHKRWGNQIFVKEKPGFIPNALRLLNP
ncbi:MAG: ABC transporter substrate-binding protein [Chitinophagales bacterium]|nr:ABC transporter substrate-binding protein [Chitinophagales bacterium]MDW8394093.1 ABC transporter substrate-binding protein [Chitinophagales bacterium]